MTEIDILQLCRQHRIDRRTLVSRLERGWPVQRAVEAPVRRYPKGVRRERRLRAKPQEPRQEVQRTLPAQLLDDAAQLLDDALRHLESQLITSPRSSRIAHEARAWVQRFRSRQ